MDLLNGLARGKDGEAANVLRDDSVHRVLGLDARELRDRTSRVADGEGVRRQRAQRRVGVIEELERLVARVRDRGRDLQVLDIGDVRRACSVSASGGTMRATARDAPATLSDTDWVAEAAVAARTMDASAALVEAENILASATDARAQELGQHGAEHGFYMRTLLCPTMLRARGPFKLRYRERAMS